MKKSLMMVFFLCMFFSLVSVSAGEFQTKVDFAISGFSGIDSLNNSDGESVIISIMDSDNNIIISRNVVAGIYLENMTITMSGDKFNLNYSTLYSYNLSTTYGDFLYNFTTPVGNNLIVTGQTTSYFDGDDAYYSGTSRDDFARTVGVDGNGTVVDSLTGLMWQDGETSTSLNWTNAILYCENLEWGGFSNWRLPNYIEFDSVMNFSTNESNYWPLAFNTRSASPFWTSTTFVPDSSNAYIANMLSGGIDFGSKSNFYVVFARCVRDQ